FMNLKGLVMLGMYLLGWVMAFIAAWVMKIFIRLREKSYYLMELPIYRLPRWKNVGVTMIEKAKVFVFDAGKVIIVISIILWFLASFGHKKEMDAVEAQYSKVSNTLKVSDTDQRKIDSRMQSEKLEASFAGHIGKFIE